jgi:hypothetical protein
MLQIYAVLVVLALKHRSSTNYSRIYLHGACFAYSLLGSRLMALACVDLVLLLVVGAEAQQIIPS